MKTFESTARQQQLLAGHLLRLGILAGVVALAWAVPTLMLPLAPGESLPQPPAPPSQTPLADQERAIAAFAGRSLREAAPPPAASIPAPPPPKVIKAPEVELVATMINPGQTPRAFVRSKGKLVNVEQGRQIEGALVKEIIEGQMILEIEGQQFTVKVGRKPS